MKDKKDLLADLKIILDELKKFDVSPSKAIELATSEKSVPLSIFSTESGPLESFVVHLHNNENLSFSEISKLLNRSYQTIWMSFKAGNLKLKTVQLNESQRNLLKSLNLNSLSDLTIPLKVFSQKNLSIYESLVKHLHQEGFRFRDIAILLNRDQRTIWTIYSRARKKGEHHEKK
ncbi:MAG: hypothetical protein AABX51_04135 [Nanoarchaeota archaeon]